MESRWRHAVECVRKVRINNDGTRLYIVQEAYYYCYNYYRPTDLNMHQALLQYSVDHTTDKIIPISSAFLCHYHCFGAVKMI